VEVPQKAIDMRPVETLDHVDRGTGGQVDNLNTDSTDAARGDIGRNVEWTRFPSALDAICDATGSVGASIRPTLVRVGDDWTRSQASLLSQETVSQPFTASDQKRARDDAFHVLDTLSRSGLLTLTDAEMHVVLAATHNFERSLIDTVVQQNIDPIGKLVDSMRLVSDTLWPDHSAQ
jgi:hypothetical protein